MVELFGEGEGEGKTAIRVAIPNDSLYYRRYLTLLSFLYYVTVTLQFIYIVLVAHWNKSKDFVSGWKESGTTQEFPIIVFDREQLIKRYGDTFRGLCSFMLSYSDRNFTQD